MASCRPTSSMSTFAAPGLLLFQPDTRLFCADGCGCQVAKKFASHRELFIHTTVDAVRLAAARDLSSRTPSTRIVNTSDGTDDAALPYVQECWSIWEGMTSSLPSAFVGKPVLVWVHGFRQRFFRVVSVAHHVLHHVREVLGADSEVVVLSFLWPCHLQGLAYSKARRDADLAGERLRSVLIALRRSGCKVLLAGHSLGCRVSLRALTVSQEDKPAGASDGNPADSEEREPLCNHLLLMAAAVPADALAPDGEFPRQTVDANQVTIMSSKHDEVLRNYFMMGEMSSRVSLLRSPQKVSAMGLHGPLPSNIPGTRWVDFSDCVSKHNPNLWLMQPRVRAVLVEALRIALAVPLLQAMPESSQVDEAAWMDDQHELNGEEEDDDVSLQVHCGDSEESAW